MVQAVDFGSGTTVTNSRLVLQVSEFFNFAGGFFDSNADMSKSCIVIQSLGDAGNVDVYSLPNGTAYAVLGEIKIIHNMTSVYDIVFYNQYNNSSGDILTSDGLDFILSPYCSAMLQYIYWADTGDEVWKVISCPSLISSISSI